MLRKLVTFGICFFIWCAIVINAPENISLIITIGIIIIGFIKFCIFIYKKNQNSPKVLPFYHIEGIKNLNQNEIINLEIASDSIVFFQKGKSPLLSIEINKIDNVQTLQEYENTEQNKSVIGRALVGGLLLGGVGAIVGGISGVGTKTKQNTLYYLEITAGENIIVLKPFFNSENIANVIKNQINKAKG